MINMNYLIGAVFLFLSLVVEVSLAGEYITPFTPKRVIVADGYLQIITEEAVGVEGCAVIDKVALPDDHKYFDAFLSLAMSAFLAEKKLNVSAGEPCIGNSWPQIKVMMLQN